MKKQLLFISALICVRGMFSQEAEQKETPIGVSYPNGVYYTKCSSFEITRPLKELAVEQEAEKKDIFDKQDADRRKPYKIAVSPNALPKGDDPAGQTTMGTRNLTAPLMNWAGQAPSQGSPLDPSGAAGKTAFVQAVNTSYRAYNKLTGAPLMASLNLSSLWTGSANDGDPIVLYDKYADRWLIQQFQSTGNKILFAISTTNDPTGSFYKFTFVPASNDFPDYPKVSIWSDGYYLTNNWSTQRVAIFDRTAMLAGNASAAMIVKTLPNIPTNGGFWCPIIGDADGVLPPSGTPASMFSFDDDSWGAGHADKIHIYKISANWTTPANTTATEDVTGGSPLTPLPFKSDFTASSMNEISQKSGTMHLDAIQSIFMYRAQYRRWTGYNTVLLNNVVDANGSGKAGIRWYELRQQTSSGAWSIYQQGTYSPDGDNRWMASLAMDDNGNIGMAYSVSGPGSNPSLRYTGRYPGDPLGTMPFAEQTAAAGTSSKSGNNRWGDYSHTSLDPDGITFWHTGMWMGSSESSRIFSFQITPSVAIGIDEHKAGETEYSAYQTDNSNLVVKAKNLSSDSELLVDLFDMEGKQLSTRTIVPAANMFETSVNVAGLAKGAYLVRIGNLNFQKVIKVILN